jgi:hypothetical protein
MKALTLSNGKPELDSQIMKTQDRSDSWLISYSDLVTVLLCFFILFFVMKSRQQEKDLIQKKKSTEKQELILREVTQKLKASNLTTRTEVAEFERHIEITSKNIFFEREALKLTLEGEYFFTEIALQIFKYIPGLQIQISLAVNDGEFTHPKSNDRINLIREYLTNLGIEQELISTGTHKAESAQTEEKINEIKVYIMNQRARAE